MADVSLKQMAVISLAIIVVLAAALYVLQPSQSTGPTEQAIADQSNTQANQSQTFNLLQSQYADYAYLISDETLSEEAKVALTGFDMNRTVLGNGDVQIDLVPLRSEYTAQSFIVKPGQKLYFIEVSMGDDDVENNIDGSIGDDTAVLVDSDGNVIQ